MLIKYNLRFFSGQKNQPKLLPFTFSLLTNPTVHIECFAISLKLYFSSSRSSYTSCPYELKSSLEYFLLSIQSLLILFLLGDNLFIALKRSNELSS